MKILLAEDDHDLRNLLHLLLENRGYHVDLVENGLEALIALFESDYDLIITDLQMPICTGFDVITGLYLNGKPEFPIIVCSGRESLRSHPIMRLNPNIRFSPKPFDMDELVKLITQFQ